MPTLQGSGTQAATVTTEHTLLDIAVAGSFVLHVNLRNMVAGDAVELKCYEKILTGDTITEGQVISQTYQGVQTSDVVVKSIPIDNDLVEAAAVRFTLKQTAGTSRNFKWKVVKL
jgi:hypothetical protein